MSTVKQVIQRRFVIKDRSLQSLHDMKIPRELWNEIRALPTFGTTFTVEEKVESTPSPKVMKEEVKPTEDEQIYTTFLEKMRNDARDGYLAYYDWLERTPSYWEDEIRKAEFRRSIFHRKAAWSATDEREIKRIDKRMEYCSIQLTKLRDQEEINTDDNEFINEDDDDVLSIHDLEPEDEFFAIESI